MLKLCSFLVIVGLIYGVSYYSGLGKIASKIADPLDWFLIGLLALIAVIIAYSAAWMIESALLRYSVMCTAFFFLMSIGLLAKTVGLHRGVDKWAERSDDERVIVSENKDGTLTYSFIREKEDEDD